MSKHITEEINKYWDGDTIPEHVKNGEVSAYDLVADGFEAGYNTSAKEVAKELNSFFMDEQILEGQYFHLGICNFSRSYPIGFEGRHCNCMNSPMLKRLVMEAPKK